MSNSAATGASALGAITISGADAPSFLRAQLTNDVLRLGPDRHFLAAWSDAKGRTLMIARVCEYRDGYLLLVPQELIDSLLKRFRMYVLRARVDVGDASDTLQVTGMTGNGLPEAECCEQRDGACLLGLAPSLDGTARALCVTPADQPAPQAGLATDDNAWERLEIDSGMPSVFAATQGLFVPQMLNLHWLQAIDFDKGCYPGQEVIARLHYRGRLTRRMFRVSWQGESPAPGEDIIDSEGARQGTVVRVATTAAGRGIALAVIKTAAVDAALRSAHADFTIEDLPYPTPD